MAKAIVLYKTPQDTAAFDAHYTSTHIPLAKKIPGLKRFEVSAGPVTTPQGPSPYHLAVVLSFDSMEALRAGFSSPEGEAATQDVATFAHAGADLLIFDTKDA